jgi:hypothetical protein
MTCARRLPLGPIHRDQKSKIGRLVARERLVGWY